MSKQLADFRRRYPSDDMAFDYLNKQTPEVLQQVLSDFNPHRASDYSSQLTAFVKMVSQRVNGGRKRKQGDSGDLRELVASVGKKLGRKVEDVEPIADVLEDNWFDTIDSLADVTQEDMITMGIPLRFGKELLDSIGKGDRRHDDW
eukprot:gb/GFBE01013886.1/.p1 GENE.gb/GFBE01013886.1/~~gb/GFBE01013886.1/.p1  ORF type:complete len:146 (+),score=29.64 gb/GFBE01013886.1/:1-438(+)